MSSCDFIKFFYIYIFWFSNNSLDYKLPLWKKAFIIVMITALILTIEVWYFELMQNLNWYNKIAN